MSANVSLVTPTYFRDFESCRLLCDSIDAFVTGYDRHYLLVADSDLELFSQLGNERRLVLSDSVLLPDGLKPLPAFLKWKGRQYYWARGAGLPVYGWHVQQLRKLAMAQLQSCARVMCIDSDNCFVRPFDVGKFAGNYLSPLYADLAGVNQTRPSHVLWQKNAYRLLGEREPPLPGDDYIGQMIVWDRESLNAILERIEKATSLPWWKALCRARDFSEYILYGVGIASNPSLMGRHQIVERSLCATYWSGPALDAAGIGALIDGMHKEQYAIAIQSHTATDPALIRRIALTRNLWS
ncbi:DUF6492 family protein [Neorhizobium sp. NCHU2750]|uniref:DUF6492 family protein n=1 Tax=Neorhizobium sp. NCHU2750 TaxID=1825976 RepID=UPI000E70F6E8|nr:hypothetical protein NCHU2750_31920 [Neorhizobium sp. NCHU2750]